MSQRIEFEWEPDDFEHLLKSCEADDAVQISLRYLTRKADLILEAGAGSGRVVKYLNDLGFRSVFGIEIGINAVKQLKRNYPGSRIIQGDLMEMPLAEGSVDVVLCFGVVEHFRFEGLASPLAAIYRVLKLGGVAIVTVPSQNHLRRIIAGGKRLVGDLSPYRISIGRKIIGKAPRSSRNAGPYPYHIHPQFGEFFEYRPTPRQFLRACKSVGFRIVDSRPIASIDGLYHLFAHKLNEPPFGQARFHVTEDFQSTIL